MGKCIYFKKGSCINKYACKDKKKEGGYQICKVSGVLQSDVIRAKNNPPVLYDQRY
jgi:hypothetical protein